MFCPLRVVLHGSIFQWLVTPFSRRLRDKLGERLHCISGLSHGHNCLPGYWVMTFSETQGLLVGTMRYFSGERHFWRKSLFRGLKSPWALFLTKRVPEVSKSVPLISQKNIFLPNQRGDLVGLFCLPFTRGCFLHRSNGKIPVRSFRKRRRGKRQP